MAAWRESDHPRDARGRFVSKGTWGAVSIKRVLANPRDVSDDDILDVFHRISQRKRLGQGGEAELKALDAELARREGSSDLEAVDDSPQARKVDELVSRGWPYADAYAEAYGLGAKATAKAQREEKWAAVDTARKPGETREKALRRMYAEQTYLSMLAAEEWTRGHTIAQKWTGKVELASLFSGPRTRARKYASEDLKRYWDEVEPRRTYAEFKARMIGNRAEAQEMALAGSGRDFGL